MSQKRNFLKWMALAAMAGMMLTGCGSKEQPETETEFVTEVMTETETAAKTEELITMEAVIEELDGKIIVLKDDQGAMYQIDMESSDLKDNQGQTVNAEELEVGQKAEIVYNGITMRNLPATIPMVTSFTIVE